MLGPQLRGNTVCLEPLESGDLVQVQAWLSDPDITDFWGSFRGYSEQQMVDWFNIQAASDTDVRWRITVAGVLVGMIVIENIDWIHRHAETGVMIGDRSAWGKGYASESVMLWTRYAFDELGLERLGSISMSENTAMHHVLEKAGYRKIGCMRRYFYRHDSWHDVSTFELLREEWRVTPGAGGRAAEEAGRMGRSCVSRERDYFARCVLKALGMNYRHVCHIRPGRPTELTGRLPCVVEIRPSLRMVR